MRMTWWWLVLLLQAVGWASASEVEAEFRGCDAMGWCRFKIELGTDPQATVLVQADGVSGGTGALGKPLRDRMNTLLSSMIHQHKRIVLRDLRPDAEERYRATVTVNGMNLAEDPVIKDLSAR